MDSGLALPVPGRNKKSCTTAPGPTYYYSTVLRSNTKVPESRRMVVSNRMILNAVKCVSENVAAAVHTRVSCPSHQVSAVRS